MRFMFQGCSSLKSVPSFDTSNVTNMCGLFDACCSLKSVPSFDTSNVIDMRYIYDGYELLERIDLYNFSKYDFSRLNNPHLQEKYPELYI